MYLTDIINNSINDNIYMNNDIINFKYEYGWEVSITTISVAITNNIH